MISRFIPLSDDSRTRKFRSKGSELQAIESIINFVTAPPFGPLRSKNAISKISPLGGAIDSQSLRTAIRQRLAAFSRLPVDRVLFDVSVHGAAYRRIKVFAAEAFE
jgi:hypothetical protein